MAILTSDVLQIDRIRYDEVDARIRGVIDGDALVDSRDAILVWTPGAFGPEWAFPESDVYLEEFYDGVVTRYSDEGLAGYVTIAWGEVDRWLVEEEVAIGHPRDPYTRIDVRRSSDVVEVRLEGELLARSTRSKLLLETGLEVRHYLPAADIRTELFVPSDTRTVCPYKGESVYRSIQLGDSVHEDVVWSYSSPLHDAEPVRDLWCFYDEKVDVTINGESGD